MLRSFSRLIGNMCWAHSYEPRHEVSLCRQTRKRVVPSITLLEHRLMLTGISGVVDFNDQGPLSAGLQYGDAFGVATEVGSEFGGGGAHEAPEDNGLLDPGPGERGGIITIDFSDPNYADKALYWTHPGKLIIVDELDLEFQGSYREQQREMYEWMRGKIEKETETYREGRLMEVNLVGHANSGVLDLGALGQVNMRTLDAFEANLPANTYDHYAIALIQYLASKAGGDGITINMRMCNSGEDDGAQVEQRLEALLGGERGNVNIVVFEGKVKSTWGGWVELKEQPSEPPLPPPPPAPTIVDGILTRNEPQYLGPGINFGIGSGGITHMLWDFAGDN